MQHFGELFIYSISILVYIQNFIPTYSLFLIRSYHVLVTILFDLFHWLHVGPPAPNVFSVKVVQIKAAFMGPFVKREDKRPKGTIESVLHTLVDVIKLSLLVALRGAE